MLRHRPHKRALFWALLFLLYACGARTTLSDNFEASASSGECGNTTCRDGQFCFVRVTKNVDAGACDDEICSWACSDFPPSCSAMETCECLGSFEPLDGCDPSGTTVCLAYVDGGEGDAWFSPYVTQELEAVSSTTPTTVICPRAELDQ